jgi:hypothetical protein
LALPVLDLFEVRQGECHLIEGLDEHQLVNMADLKRPRTRREPYLLRWQIHRHLFEATGSVGDLFDRINRKRHWEHAVGEAVRCENVSETRSDHATKPETDHRPYRGLA